MEVLDLVMPALIVLFGLMIVARIVKEMSGRR